MNRVYGSSEVNSPESEVTAVHCANEMNRVLRTRDVARTINSLFPIGPFDRSKISPLPDCADRVGQIATPICTERCQTGIEQALEEERAILEDPAVPIEADKRNFLIQVNQLVAEMMQLLSKLSDRERNKTDFSKNEYNVFNTRVAKYTEKQGTVGLGVAIVAFLITGGTSFLGETGQKIGSALAGQSQHVSSYLTSGLAAESGRYSNKMNLISTDLSAMSSKNNDSSAWKNELIQSLNDIKEWLRASVRSNG